MLMSSRYPPRGANSVHSCIKVKMVTALLARICSQFCAVNCMGQLRSSHPLRAILLGSHMLPVSFFPSAFLESCSGWAAALWLSLRELWSQQGHSKQFCACPPHRADGWNMVRTASKKGSEEESGPADDADTTSFHDNVDCFLLWI